VFDCKTQEAVSLCTALKLQYGAAAGISEAQITAIPSLTALRRVMVRLGRDGLGNSMAFGGRPDDFTRLLVALAALRPAAPCSISACIVAVTRAVELPSAVRGAAAQPRPVL